MKNISSSMSFRNIESCFFSIKFKRWEFSLMEEIGVLHLIIRLNFYIALAWYKQVQLNWTFYLLDDSLIFFSGFCFSCCCCWLFCVACLFHHFMQCHLLRNKIAPSSFRHTKKTIDKINIFRFCCKALELTKLVPTTWEMEFEIELLLNTQ